MAAVEKGVRCVEENDLDRPASSLCVKRRAGLAAIFRNERDASSGRATDRPGQGLASKRCFEPPAGQSWPSRLGGQPSGASCGGQPMVSTGLTGSSRGFYALCRKGRHDVARRRSAPSLRPVGFRLDDPIWDRSRTGKNALVYLQLLIEFDRLARITDCRRQPRCGSG